MRMRSCLSAVSLAAIASALAAQTTPSGYKVPRMQDGHPDLGGTHEAAVGVNRAAELIRQTRAEMGRR